MKLISQYIKESIKKLNGKTGIIVFDIDDTLLKVQLGSMYIYKHIPGSDKEIKLSTEEFAKDLDAQDPNKRSWFDYRDFRDEQNVYNSIVNGTPMIKNLKIMDAYLNAGYDFCFLTARGCEDVVKRAIGDFVKRRNEGGALEQLGNEYKKTLSHAVNDYTKNYQGKTDSDKKANVLKQLCRKYDMVVFVDDDIKNVRKARELNIKNLRVIKAWEE
jgi:acid phosphatase class B